MGLGRRCIAEFLGTFWLVFGGCGSAMFAAGVADVGIGWVGVSFAFGLTVLTMAYAIGHISGCHLNPAVSIGLVAGGRFSSKDLLPYVIAQVLGGIAAGAVLYFVMASRGGFDAAANGFASNGFDLRSPEKFPMIAAFVIEALLTMFFLFVIMGATSKKAPAGFAPIAIGMCLVLIHLIGIPITNLSVNPARSTGVGIFAGAAAISQLWLFWVAPILGGIVGGIAYRSIDPQDEDKP